MKHRKMAIIVGIIFLIVCTGLYIFIYTIPKITGALKKTAIVEYGQMRTEILLPAIIVRDETVINAPSSGNITYYIDDNIKTRRGIKVADIYGSVAETMNSPATGVVSYYYDGYESTFTVDNLSQVDTLIPCNDKGEQQAIEPKDIRKSKITQADPAYKLIQNDVWYTVLLVPNSDLYMFEASKSVNLEFETGSVKAKVNEIFEKEEISLVVVSTSKYFKDYDKLRTCNVNVVLKDDKGLIIPNTAIAVVDGQSGVYVKKINGDYVFTRIKTISSDENNSVCYSDSFSVLREDGLTDTVYTINIYDEILKDASEYNQ